MTPKWQVSTYKILIVHTQRCWLIFKWLSMQAGSERNIDNRGKSEIIHTNGSAPFAKSRLEEV